jgi:hypothetical protein
MRTMAPNAPAGSDCPCKRALTGHSNKEPCQIYKWGTNDKEKNKEPKHHRCDNPYRHGMDRSSCIVVG